MFQDRIKLLRESHGLTKKEIAKAIGITERAYITYEYGQREPSMETIIKLAKYYGTTTVYLLGVETADPPNPLDMLNLSNLEKLILQTYISVSPKTRKELEEVIMKIADGADLQIVAKKPEIQQTQKDDDSDEYIVQTTTVGKEMDRREAEQARRIADVEAKENVV